MSDVDGIEPYQRGEQAPVSLGDDRTGQVALRVLPAFFSVTILTLNAWRGGSAMKRLRMISYLVTGMSARYVHHVDDVSNHL